MDGEAMRKLAEEAAEAAKYLRSIPMSGDDYGNPTAAERHKSECVDTLVNALLAALPKAETLEKLEAMLIDAGRLDIRVEGGDIGVHILPTDHRYDSGPHFGLSLMAAVEAAAKGAP